MTGAQLQRQMMATKPNVGRELLDVPMGDMIRDMAFAIADAQMKLDANSIEVAQMMGGIKQVIVKKKFGIFTKEEVVYEDSRVFFGKEKLKLLDAIDIYNSSTDVEYKVRILKALGTNYYTYVCTPTSYPSYDKLKEDGSSPKVLKDSGIYQLSDKKTFYSYDKNTKTLTEVKYYDVPIVKAANVSDENAIFVPTRVSMLELGFSPTFYQFVDTIIEVKMSITYTSEGTNSKETESSTKAGASGGFLFGKVSCARASSVNASYSQKFNYSTEGSSLLRTKLVPIPPPAILEERIRAIMEVAKEENAPATPPDNKEGDANQDQDQE